MNIQKKEIKGNRFGLRDLFLGGLIAALYLVLTYAVSPIAFASLQFRVSEALVVLPALTPVAIPGLTIGVVLANFLGGNLGIIDIVFGSLATFIAAYLTYLLGRCIDKQNHSFSQTGDQAAVVSVKSLEKQKLVWCLPLPAILVNGLIVGTYLPYLLLDPTANEVVTLGSVLLSIVLLMFSEAVVVILLGMPLYFMLKKFNVFN